MAANDHSRIGNVTTNNTHDYQAYMKFCRDDKNWFMRARRLVEDDRWFEQPLPFEGET